MLAACSLYQIAIVALMLQNWNIPLPSWRGLCYIQCSPHSHSQNSEVSLSHPHIPYNSHQFLLGYNVYHVFSLYNVGSILITHVSQVLRTVPDTLESTCIKYVLNKYGIWEWKSTNKSLEFCYGRVGNNHSRDGTAEISRSCIFQRLYMLCWGFEFYLSHNEIALNLLSSRFWWMWMCLKWLWEHRGIE